MIRIRVYVHTLAVDSDILLKFGLHRVPSSYLNQRCAGLHYYLLQLLQAQDTNHTLLHYYGNHAYVWKANMCRSDFFFFSNAVLRIHRMALNQTLAHAAAPEANQDWYGEYSLPAPFLPLPFPSLIPSFPSLSPFLLPFTHPRPSPSLHTSLSLRSKTPQTGPVLEQKKWGGT